MEGLALKPLDLFVQAGPVVKAVMILLLVFSVWCWVIIVECCFALGRLGGVPAKSEEPRGSAMISDILEAGRIEASVHYPDEDRAERRRRVNDAMRRQIQVVIERAQGGLGNLAVISSVAPFVGLFGTVWGIMTSFLGIAAAKDTSLAVVAPGIAEALAATAVGLAAAIPAAFAYNRLVSAFARRSRTLVRFADQSVAVLLDQGSRAEPAR